MKITVNGDILEMKTNASISDLLAKLAITATRVAVECNMEIIAKTEYTNTVLQANDTLEIVSFVGGG